MSRALAMMAAAICAETAAGVAAEAVRTAIENAAGRPAATPANWDRRFIDMAYLVATWSKDPSTRVGAVIVRPDRTIASLGFNGFPRGVKDLPERLADRQTKYAMTIHAELNAIISAKEPLTGHTLYVAPFHPCSSCAAAIIQSGISRVVTVPGDGEGRWAESFRTAAGMLSEAGVVATVLEGAG